jgi:hypothetical protein
MAERDPMTQPAAPTGSGSETTTAAPESAPESTGKSTTEAPESKSVAPDTAETEETFYDPKTAPPELQGEYKKMQAAFTKKMQAIAKNREKISSYEEFEKNPVSTMQRLAAQYGMKLTPAQAQAAIDSGSTPGGTSENWNPNSWQEVEQRISQAAEKRILSQLSPLLSEVHKMKQSAIEHQLSEIDPSWQAYEDAMITNLKSHPTLAQDPALLYRMSVPAETIESKAVQKALKRFEDKGKATAAAGSSTTGKRPAAGLREAKSVQEAWDIAREKLAEDGIHPPNRR